MEPADPWRRVPNPERKRITDQIKMVAYRAETEPANLVGPFLRLALQPPPSERLPRQVRGPEVQERH